ncbi:hypothetical protein RDB90_005659 [Salmonella enterica]|nr:hypothetical protein [Salmonella enterica subsp. enterica serovar Oranienburg]EEI9430726.1 hypothetical protein [Salmonella enterica subsp. diarizonae]ELE1937007.1 hypothetical protein [Salmonella enterica]MIP07479.1 hypothetical protein [Salmonella enterica subsp. enterica serovar Oranienburg]
MTVQTENTPDVTGMERDDFVGVIRHRASLLSAGLQPGYVIIMLWCSKRDSWSWLYQLHGLSGAFMSTCFTTEEVKQFWYGFTEQPALKQLLWSMGSLTYRRGLGGGRRYSVSVFHLVIRDFITQYVVLSRKYRRPKFNTVPGRGEIFFPLNSEEGENERP